jgi:hypothetical protein
VTAPGVVQIRGNARGDVWAAYRLMFAPGWAPGPEQWIQIGPDHPEQVSDGVLENWDITNLPSGPYSLKLTRIGSDGSFTDFVSQVTIDNISPTLRLLQPAMGEVFRIKRDEWVPLVADVRDDYAVAKVEFYANGQLFEVRTVAPFTTRWTLQETGSFEFYAVAYDAAGNRTESARVSVTVVTE